MVCIQFQGATLDAPQHDVVARADITQNSPACFVSCGKIFLRFEVEPHNVCVLSYLHVLSLLKVVVAENDCEGRLRHGHERCFRLVLGVRHRQYIGASLISLEQQLYHLCISGPMQELPDKMLCNAAIDMLSVLQVWQHDQLCLSSCFADTVLISGIAILNVVSLLWTASQVRQLSPSSLFCPH